MFYLRLLPSEVEQRIAEMTSEDFFWEKQNKNSKIRWAQHFGKLLNEGEEEGEEVTDELGICWKEVCRI